MNMPTLLFNKMLNNATNANLDPKLTKQRSRKCEFKLFWKWA